MCTLKTIIKIQECVTINQLEVNHYRLKPKIKTRSRNSVHRTQPSRS